MKIPCPVIIQPRPIILASRELVGAGERSNGRDRQLVASRVIVEKRSRNCALRDVGEPVGVVVPVEYRALPGRRHVGAQADIVIGGAHGAILLFSWVNRSSESYVGLIVPAMLSTTLVMGIPQETYRLCD